MYSIKKICCIGAGYVGGPTMAVFAKNCPNIEFEVVDINEERINAWNNNDLAKLPVFEPGLSEIIKVVRGRNLFFSTNIHHSIKNADMVFISVNTPIKKTGIGAGETSDLRWVESCARQIGEVAENHTIVVEKSTLPVRTAQTIKDILLSSNSTLKNKSFSVLSNPEFLAEGTAIRDLEQPDRVLIGGDDKEAMDSLNDIYLNWIPQDKLIFTNLWSSELSKLTANAFLAQRISSINSISAICESTGADVNEVAEAIGKDSRIGYKFLKSGPGFGGSCFKKDILNLVYLAKYYGLFEVADYWRSVVEINSWQQKRVYEVIVTKLFGNLADKKIAILGFAFKKDTNDTRESPSIEICKNLLNEGAFLSIHDVKVSKDIIEKILCNRIPNLDDNFELNKSNWEYQEDLYEAIKNSDAVVLLTDWEVYKTIDWELVSKNVKSPFWLFDTRSVLKDEKIKNLGINIWQLGNSNKK